jgi:hypothetical protein
MGKIVVSENVTLDGVIQDPAGDGGFRADGRAGLIGNSPQLAKLALDEALAAGAFLLSACSARPATRSPRASSTPRPSRAASPTSPTNLSGTPSGVRRR